MRVVHNDFARYNLSDEENDDLGQYVLERTLSVRMRLIHCSYLIGEQDNYGWKLISTDVFRFPSNKSLLCSILGEYFYATYIHVLANSISAYQNCDQV